ncbi:MAG: 30S ribosomal protein S12 methylthiotransferase RimO [Christensenellaceae bacterium]
MSSSIRAPFSTGRKESIDTILEARDTRKTENWKIVVTGCLPQKFIGELYDPLTEADVFLGIHDYEKIFEALEASYAGNERENYVGKGSDGFRAARVLTTWPHYAYLKIADGCYNHCTYCLIPKIRGKYVSYPMEDLLKEAENLGEVSELVVVAQDTTRYGEDLYGVNKFPELLHRLSLLENVRRIRLLYCYPDVIGDELIAEIRHNEKIVKYIDIPLQHSEDRVLKLMNRKGTRKSYLALIEKLRREIPDIAIRSTFISGFPTETEKEFEEMKAFLREAELVNCGFFAYSREPDTAAARMSPQVHPSTKRRRVRELYEMQREISKKLLSSFVGKELEVLCDGIDYEKNCFVGRAYFSAPEIDGRVYFHAREVMQGETYKVVINSADSYDLYGETEDYRS